MLDLSCFLPRQETEKHIIIIFKILFQLINELMEVIGDSNFNPITHFKLPYESNIYLLDICYRLKINEEKLYNCIVTYKNELIYDTPFKDYDKETISNCINSIKYINNEDTHPFFKYDDLYDIIIKTQNYISDRVCDSNLAYYII